MKKEVLGIWIGANESSKFGLSVLNDLKNRGVEDVLIFCVDELNGFKEAIGATFPFAKIQRCIIHQIRASMKYIPYKGGKIFAGDLKGIYTAVNEEVTLENLLTLKDKWSGKYPNIIKSLEDNWDNLSTFFALPNDDSLLKMLYLAVERIKKKWTRSYPDWDLVINQLFIVFSEIFERVLKKHNKRTSKFKKT